MVGNGKDATDFIVSLLQASTEYAIIGKDIDGTVLLWNEGARRLYGYEPDEVVGKMKASTLHTPADIAAGVPGKFLAAALSSGKWEGTLQRRRKNGTDFTARLVITPRRDALGAPIGYLLISKDPVRRLFSRPRARHAGRAKNVRRRRRHRLRADDGHRPCRPDRCLADRCLVQRLGVSRPGRRGARHFRFCT